MADMPTKLEDHATPTILDFYARVVQKQQAEEEERGVSALRAKVLPRFDELCDWFGSLLICPRDAEAYATQLIRDGYDSLETLSTISAQSLPKYIKQPAHLAAIGEHLSTLSCLTTIPREHCWWQWHDGLTRISALNRTRPDNENEENEDDSADSGSDGSDGSNGGSDREAEPSPSAKDAGWVSYSVEACHRIETARLTGQMHLEFTMGHNQKYRIDLVQLKQINLRTGYRRDIRRVPHVVCKLSVPNAFLCPIGLGVMRDPVIAADGHSYDRNNIDRWLTNHDTSPKTMLHLDHKTLLPNLSLKLAVDQFITFASQL